MDEIRTSVCLFLAFTLGEGRKRRAKRKTYPGLARVAMRERERANEPGGDDYWLS